MLSLRSELFIFARDFFIYRSLQAQPWSKLQTRKFLLVIVKVAFKSTLMQIWKSPYISYKNNVLKISHSQS